MVGFDTNAPLGSLDDLVAGSHVGNVIYLGGWDGADKVTRTSRAPAGAGVGPSTGDVGLLIAADQEGGEVHQLRGEGFTRPPSAKQQATDVVGRADQGRHRLGARAQGCRGQRQPGAGHRHGARGHRPRQRADRPATGGSTAPTRRPSSGPRPRSSRGCSPVASRARSSTSRGWAGSATTPTSTRPASPTTSPTADDPYLEPFAAGVEAGAGLVMVGSATLQQARPRGAGDVLGADRHRPAARRPRLRRASSSPTTSTPRRWRAPRPAAGGAVVGGRRRHRAHGDASVGAGDARGPEGEGGRRPRRSPPRSTRRCSGC